MKQIWEKEMKKLITTLLALCLMNSASFSDVKLGIIIGFTGPIESLAPDMAAGAEAWSDFYRLAKNQTIIVLLILLALAVSAFFFIRFIFRILRAS